MIYMIKIVGMPILKIGYSENFASRLSHFKQILPFEVECLAERSGSFSLEYDIHKICSEFHMKNEWYPDVPFVRTAFFNCIDRYPNLDKKQMVKAKKRERDEYLLAFGLGKINLRNEVVLK